MTQQPYMTDANPDATEPTGMCGSPTKCATCPSVFLCTMKARDEQAIVARRLRVQQPQHLTIEDWLPDQISNGSIKSNWRKVAKAKKAAKTMAWASAKQAGWEFVPGRVRLSIVYVFSVNRTRDTDNLYARSIGLVNGLKGTFFEDDSTDVLDLVVTAEVRRGVKATEITLAPAAGQ